MSNVDFDNFRTKSPVLKMEEKIIAMLRHQNDGAIALLYDNYAPALFGIIVRVVRSQELAEQVLQDTFVKVWKNATHFDSGKGRLFTWLLNIARNTAIDATRTAHFKHYSKIEDEKVLNTRSGDLDINPDHIGLRNLVGSLDEKYRVLIEKIYFEGYTHSEIEEEMGIPAGTVKTRLRFAINELRKKFSEGNVGELASLLLFLESFSEALPTFTKF